MPIDIHPQTLGTASPRSYPYASSLSSSASSSTSSVFSDVASQLSNSSASTAPSQGSIWDSEKWSRTTRSVLPGPTVDPSGLNSFAPITRVSTFPQYQPSACRDTALERSLPPLRTEAAVPAEQRQHPRRSSSTTSSRAPPALVRQCERKVNFVECLVG